MSAFQIASSKSFTSTPLKSKSSIPMSIPRSKSVESTGDSTYSLLSPIYHDSFELSDEENVPALNRCQSTSPDKPSSRLQDNEASQSRHDAESLHAQDDTCIANLNLSAWEQWVVSKAKEERSRMHQKSLEQQVLKEKKERDEREHQRKKTVSECKIQEWLQMKRKQEKQEKFYRESQKTKELLNEEQKRLEIEKKAQVNYKEWLQKKKQEEMQRKEKEQEEEARRRREESERKEKAEEMFKKWFKSLKDRDKHKQQSPRSVGGYDHLNYPAPGFVNPIPWKPVHIPNPNGAPGKKSVYKKHQSRPKYQSTPCISYKHKDAISFACQKR